jgi:hypothetical protein
MQAREVTLMEVVAFCGYNAIGARLLLTVECNTLVSGEGVAVAGGTLSSSAVPTLKAVALGGGAGLIMVRKYKIAVLRLAASMAVIGMVLRSVQRTLHATRTVRSAVEIVGIAQWLG